MIGAQRRKQLLRLFRWAMLRDGKVDKPLNDGTTLEGLRNNGLAMFHEACVLSAFFRSFFFDLMEFLERLRVVGYRGEAVQPHC